MLVEQGGHMQDQHRKALERLSRTADATHRKLARAALTVTDDEGARERRNANRQAAVNAYAAKVGK